MAKARPLLSVMTLGVNRLHEPIKRQRFAEWKKQKKGTAIHSL